MNRLILIISMLLASLTCWAVDYEEYERLYPECNDAVPSKIYPPSKWPKEMNPPEFPGGAIELTRFVFHNNDYPEVVDSVSTDSVTGQELTWLIRGTVLVRITIDRCGRVQNPQIVQSVVDAYDNEAIRLMEALPRFKPAEIVDDQGGYRVKADLIIPVHFNRVHPKPKIDEEYEYEYDYSDDYYY